MREEEEEEEDGAYYSDREGDVGNGKRVSKSPAPRRRGGEGDRELEREGDEET